MGFRVQDKYIRCRVFQAPTPNSTNMSPQAFPGTDTSDPRQQEPPGCGLLKRELLKKMLPWRTV